MRLLLPVYAVCLCVPVFGLEAGVARVSITPLEENLPTQLGGYGERAGKPAEGIHDTIYAKVLVLAQGDERCALVTLDMCSVPLCVVEESLAKAGVEGLSVDNVMMSASHSHAGLEGFSLDRRNVAGNPHIGIFSEPVLEFVTSRIAQGLREAVGAMQPVRAGAGTVALDGMNRNRRGDDFVDADMTLLRLDTVEGNPLAVLVNFTAHGTLMTEKEMLISGGWPGVMQRTCEALVGEGVTCMYTNGAEGDMSPAGAQGGSRWEMAEDYGRRAGIAAAKLTNAVETHDVDTFAVESVWVDLPLQQGAPDFVEIAGDEYHVTEKQLGLLLSTMFPGRAPFYALRINDFQMMTYPGEPICQYGLAVKEVLRQAGIAYPCVAALTSDHIGYVLTPEEYRESGYEVTASFYGDGLGPLLLKKVTALGTDVAKGK